jgi:hypothetical protein
LDSWELLLAKALACLDSARTQGLTIGEWTFGGGTGLMCHFDHRFSRDIDIFVPDAAYLPYLSPRLNDAIAGRTDDYDEAAHYVKLRFSEGEIDFIVATTLTSPGLLSVSSRASLSGSKCRPRSPSRKHITGLRISSHVTSLTWPSFSESNPRPFGLRHTCSQIGAQRYCTDFPPSIKATISKRLMNSTSSRPGIS